MGGSAAEPLTGASRRLCATVGVRQHRPTSIDAPVKHPKRNLLPVRGKTSLMFADRRPPPDAHVQPRDFLPRPLARGRGLFLLALVQPDGGAGGVGS